jgi:hypothetical protein
MAGVTLGLERVISDKITRGEWEKRYEQWISNCAKYESINPPPQIFKK